MITEHLSGLHDTHFQLKVSSKRIFGVLGRRFHLFYIHNQEYWCLVGYVCCQSFWRLQVPNFCIWVGLLAFCQLNQRRLKSRPVKYVCRHLFRRPNPIAFVGYDYPSLAMAVSSKRFTGSMCSHCLADLRRFVQSSTPPATAAS